MKYSPLYPWFGGKWAIAPEVWLWLGQPKTFVDPFFGSGAMFFSRPKSSFPTGKPIEVVNDLSGYIVNSWRAIKHSREELLEYLVELYAENTVHARHAWLMENTSDLVPRLEGDPEYHDVRTAGYWMWGACAHMGQGFAHGRGPWRVVQQGEYCVLANTGSGYLSRQLPSFTKRGVATKTREELQVLLERYALRLADAYIMCGDWTRVVTKATLLRTPTAVFLDPPYLSASRKGRSTLYENDEDDVAAAAMQWALENGDNPDYRIALCGYEGDYEMPDEWTALEWRASRGFSKGESPRSLERVWLSPSCSKSVQLSLFEE